jgi:aryl carrier-like protein
MDSCLLRSVQILQLRGRQLRADGYNVTVQTLVKRMCSTEFEADVLNTMDEVKGLQQ